MSIFKGPKARATKFARVSAGLAADFASTKAKSLFQNTEEKAQSEQQFKRRLGNEVAQTLSEMKGPLMKVGQIFSQVKDVLPPEVSDALGQLRQNAKPIDYAIIAETIEKEFGKSPELLFAEFDQTPYRAASLGQVHKARLFSGEDVVVKVQYPDVKEHCLTDLKHLKRLLKILPLMGIEKKSTNAIYTEAESVIHRELDYLLEAESAQKFYDFYQDNDQVIVPKVYPEYSTSTILTLELIQGASLISLQELRKNNRGDDSLTRKVAENLLDCMLQQIFIFQTIHVDPHAGNFAYKPSGQIIMFDYGAVKQLEPNIVDLFKQAVEAALVYDYAEIERLLILRGIRRPKTKPLGEAFYKPWVELANTPFVNEKFDFSQSNLHQQAMKLIKKDWKQNTQSFSPNGATLLLDRLIVGHYWNLVHLAVECAPGEILKKYVNYSPH